MNCAAQWASLSSAAKPPNSSSPIANADSAPHAKRSPHKITESAGLHPKSLDCETRPHKPYPLIRLTTPRSSSTCTAAALPADARLPPQNPDNAASSAHGLLVGGDVAVRRTWGEDHHEARRIAGPLANAGAGPGSNVAILAAEPTDAAPVAEAVWMRGAASTASRSFVLWICTTEELNTHDCAAPIFEPGAAQAL